MPAVSHQTATGAAALGPCCFFSGHDRYVVALGLLTILLQVAELFPSNITYSSLALVIDQCEYCQWAPPLPGGAFTAKVTHLFSALEFTMSLCDGDQNFCTVTTKQKMIITVCKVMWAYVGFCITSKLVLDVIPFDIYMYTIILYTLTLIYSSV